MANKQKLTKRGQTLKGALATYLTPRLAADGALKPGELDKLLLSIKPAPYKEQIPVIGDAVKVLAKDRFAKDASADDLVELLEALSGEDLDEDDEDEGTGTSDETDDENEIVEDDPGTKLMGLLGQCKIPPDMLEQINACVTAMGSGKGEGAMADKFGPGGFKPKEKEEPPVSVAAMDAAIAKAVSAGIAPIAADTRKQMAELFAAAEIVAPVIGKVDTLAFDSAADIFALALDQLKVDHKDVHPSALRRLFELASVERIVEPQIAADAAGSYEDFSKRYTHIPAQA